MNAFDSYEMEEETTKENMVLGLIGGMLDGKIKTFDYRDMRVNRMNGSIFVSPKEAPEKWGGGGMLLETTTIHGVKDWLDEKAEIYGDNA